MMQAHFSQIVNRHDHNVHQRPVVVVKNSRLESFLKRNLDRNACGSSSKSEERVVHYEGCVLLPILPVSHQPFYAYVVLTDRRILFTELPPKKLQRLVELDDINNIAAVAEAPPNFLFDKHREIAQRIRIDYTDETRITAKGKGGGKRSNLHSASREVDSTSKAYTSSSSDFSEIRSGISSTSSSSSSSGASSSGISSGSASDSTCNSSTTTTTAPIVNKSATSIDIILLVRSSEFGQVIYVTWLRRLTWPRNDTNMPPQLNNIDRDMDGSARYQWLIRSMAQAKETKECTRLHYLLRTWSSDSANFVQHVWHDSRVLDWLLTNLKRTPSFLSSFNPSKSLAAILDFVNRDDVCRILNPHYSHIGTLIIDAKKNKTISTEDCCEIMFAILLLPCSIFTSKVVSLILLSEWIVIVGCIAKRLITIIRRNHISEEDCLALFKCLFVLRRLLEFDKSCSLLRYLSKNHSDEFR